MIHRIFPIVLCATISAALLSGCASTRMGSFPKINWAWWKKPSAPGGRHDEAIAAPSATMSPVNALVKSDSASPASEKTRRPYDTGSSPPESRSFAGETGNTPGSDSGTADVPSAAYDLLAKSRGSEAASMSSGQPTGSDSVESTLSKSLANSSRKSFELTPSTPDTGALNITRPNNYLPGQSTQTQAAPGGPGTATAESSGPKRMTNPYATESLTAKPNLATNKSGASATTNPSSPQLPAGGTVSGAPYARTPYSEFSPKPGGPQTNPLVASAPSPAGSTTNANPLQPMGTTASKNGTAQGAAGSTSGSYAGGTIAQVSYTPGSIGDSRPISELLDDAPPATSATATTPANQTTPQPTATDSPVRLGGGGSFRIVK